MAVFLPHPPARQFSSKINVYVRLLVFPPYCQARQAYLLRPVFPPVRSPLGSDKINLPATSVLCVYVCVCTRALWPWARDFNQFPDKLK